MISTSESGQKKVLLTGCFGNVGSNALRYLLDRNKKVDNSDRVVITCFDKPSPLSKQAYTKIVKEYGVDAFITIWGDLTNEDDVVRAVNGQDSIIHLAAVIPPLAYKIPEIARKVNVGGTEFLLKAASAQEKKPRFVQASSYSVLGPHNPNKNGPYLTGKMQTNPKESYGAHKSECEAMVRKYEGEWAILRIGAVSVDIDMVLGANPSQGGLETMLFGVPANQKRHGVHSKDVGKAFSECGITDEPVHGKTLMIGGDSSWMVRASEFNNVIFRVLGVGSIRTDAYRAVDPDVDEAFYYEDWMDTAESQSLLRFQDHTLEDWRKELEAGVPVLQYYLTRLVAPIARWFVARKSPYLKLNQKGVPYPEQRMPFADIVKSKPDQ